LDKIINLSVWLSCPVAQAFEMFTKNAHLQSWLTELADVEPAVGGKYELFWNPSDKENDSTIGCKVLAIQPEKYLAFEWKGPSQFKHFMNIARPLTHVVIYFLPMTRDKAGQTFTEVHMIHTGWRESDEWEEARAWFESSWANAFEKLSEVINKKAQ
jgi:uncharacterized protein YndB with AHSA1/START domain